MALPWDEVQGNVYPGFKKDHQAFLFVRFDGLSTAAARAWVGELQAGSGAQAGGMTSATAVQRFKAERLRQIELGRPEPTARWVNVAFSYRGIAKLDPPGHADLPSEFKAGPRERARRVGDDPAQMPTWSVGGGDDTEADAVLILAADTPAELKGLVDDQRTLLGRHRLRDFACLEGASLGGRREHFGFRDDIAQPEPVESVDATGSEDQILAGEFVLGLPRERHLDPAGHDLPPPPIPGPWAAHGSYVVFRQFQQAVLRFREEAERRAAELARHAPEMDPQNGGVELFKATCIGRWPNGAPVSQRPPPQNPSDEQLTVTAADYERDPCGFEIPRYSHIRKMHPRNVPRADGRSGQQVPVARSHRLLRRGIPYGPLLAPGATADDGKERGLFFLVYQASIAEQFEFVIREWANNRAFSKPTNGVDTTPSSPGRDPVVGVDSSSTPAAAVAAGGAQGRGEQNVPAGPPRTLFYPLEVKTLPDGSKRLEEVPFTLERFVATRGGGYFFSPSIPALRVLAAPGDA